MRRLIWTCVVVWLGGCEIPPEVKGQLACTTLCNCFQGPIGQEACVTDCIEDGVFGSAPDDCIECIQAHATTCSTLQSECMPVCSVEPPPEDFPDGGVR